VTAENNENPQPILAVSGQRFEPPKYKAGMLVVGA
jgi:hypothetical protein